MSTLLWASASRRVAVVGFTIGLVALLLMPAAWALSSAVSAGRVQFPTAGAWRVVPREGPASRPARDGQAEKLLRFLDENRHGERFLVAVPDAPHASPLIIASGEPVLAIGGYTGADAILTPEELAHLVAKREIRFIMIMSADERARRTNRNATLSDWVLQNGKLVDPALWNTAPQQPAEEEVIGSRDRRPARGAFRNFARLQLYDLLGADQLISPVSN